MQGLRTLVLATKIIPEEIYVEWDGRYQEAGMHTTPGTCCYLILLSQACEHLTGAPMLCAAAYPGHNSRCARLLCTWF